MDQIPRQAGAQVHAIRGRGLRKHLRQVKNSLASRYYQLLSGNAVTGAFLCERAGSIESNECWRRDSGRRQSRHHLFVLGPTG